MPDAVLAIDQGTTGSTALVLDRDGRVLGRATEEFTQFYPQPGWVEHDPEEIWRVSLEVIGRGTRRRLHWPTGEPACHRHHQPARNHRRLGPQDGRSHYTGRSSGRAGRPPTSARKIRDNGLEPMITERTGLVVDPYFSGSKVKWILDHYPEARPRAEAGELVFGTIDTWMLYKLTGGEVLATEPTNASRTPPLRHPRAQPGIPSFSSIFGVPEAMLPEVRPSSGVFGTTVPAGALPGGVPVAGIAGDQQAALYGQGLLAPGYGQKHLRHRLFRDGQHRLRAPAGADCGLLTTVCCDAHGGAAYALEGSVFTTGAAVQWLRDEMGLIGSAVETEEVAARVRDTQGVYVVPAFAGSRRALLGHARAGRHRRADPRQRPRPDHPRHPRQHRLPDPRRGRRHEQRRFGRTGHSSSAPTAAPPPTIYLMQFQADILGVPVVRPRLLETTAAGSAFLAGLGVGMWRDPEELEGAWREDRSVSSPEWTQTERDRLYLGWRAAVERVRADRRETP